MRRKKSASSSSALRSQWAIRNEVICNYALDTTKTEEEINSLAHKNDSNIENIEVNYTVDGVDITLKKHENSLFSKILKKDKDLIQVKVSCIEENK